MTKINLGSGPVKGENGWTNIDQLEGADLKIDITQGLPFPQGSIEMIYTSHFLEHLDYPILCKVLEECHRVLAPGHPISICVPDASKFISAYVQDEYQNASVGPYQSLRVPSFLIAAEEGIYSKALVNTGSAIDWINYIAYSNSEHKYMFDSENLLSHMRIAGFNNVALRDFDPALDKPYGRQASIYAIGYKQTKFDPSTGNQLTVF